jgi:class 3 adenylate cyclase
MSQTRRLAAILAADVAGYARLMGEDEEGTLERLKALRRELLDPKIAEHHGPLVKTTGDGMLVEFSSTVDMLRGETLDKAIAPGSFNMAVRERVPWHRPEDYAHMVEGLRKAGWEGWRSCARFPDHPAREVLRLFRPGLDPIGKRT